MSRDDFTNASKTGHQALVNIALLGRKSYRDPFSFRAEGIAHQAILRADVHGMKHYGPAPAPLDEKRDMYQEAIEELLDAIYYLARQVAKLEDLREKLASSGPRPAA